MQVFFIFVGFCFFLWLIRHILFWVSLWQDREYRLDRLLVNLKESYRGKQLFFSPFNIVKIALILAFGLVAFYDKLLFPYQILIGVVYCMEGVFVVQEILTHRLKRPIITLKATVIFFMSFMFVTLLLFLPLTDKFLWFLIVDKLIFVVVALFVFFFAFPTEIYTDILIQKARKRLIDNKNLLIIAVSGSYGKSSTKEFIAQVLSEKYQVVKTFGSQNTPIAIAKTIIDKITDATDIFIVEMGAYKKGEIAEICYFVTPKVSVTTSVSDQHLSLYGSVKNAIETEVELLRALPKNSVSLFNGNNENTLLLYAKYKRKKILYRCNYSEFKPADITASNVIVRKDSVSFTVNKNGKLLFMKTHLLGVHMIENILPAIFLADYLKIKTTAIKHAVANLLPPPKTMIKKILKNGSVAIDDTFNASPESVASAIEYIKIYEKKKFFVLTPLIELGAHAKNHHYEIGKMIGAVCDYLFLTNNNFYADIVRGIRDSRGICQVMIFRQQYIAQKIHELAKKGDVILFEGKEAAFVLQTLI